MPRLFTGIFLPDSIRRQAVSVQSNEESIRWIPESRLHATLVFVGQVADETANAVQTALSDVSFEPFTLKLRGVGAFPSPRRARVLWTGLSPEPPLAGLHDNIQTRIRDHIPGKPESRRYVPHVTLGRTRRKRRIDMRAWTDRHVDLTSAPFDVHAFHLVESRTHPEGAEYIVVETYGAGSRPGR